MSENSHNRQSVYEMSNQKTIDFFRFIGRITATGLLVLVLLHFAVGQYDSSYPWLPLVAVNLVSFAFVLLSLLLKTGNQPTKAVTLYLAAVMFTLITSLFLWGGFQSPISKAFLAVVMFAGIMANRKTASVFFFFSIIATVMMLLMSFNGLIPTAVLQTKTLLVADSVVLVILLLVTLGLTTFISQNNEILERNLRHRDRELVTAVNTTESALLAADGAREKERTVIEQLQQLVQHYISYLGRVNDGDYTAHFTYPEQDYSEVPELLHLGQMMKVTIDQLTNRFEELETAQRMYIQQAWESFMRYSSTPQGYVYDEKDKTLKDSPDTWTPAMYQALQSGDLTTASEELGIALSMRGAKIGAIGLRHSNRAAWTENEVGMVRDIVDQLTQTIERLRLVDDISRRAALEATSSKVTANIRAEVDIEAVLKRALSELGAALQAEQGIVQLSLSEDREDAL